MPNINVINLSVPETFEVLYPDGSGNQHIFKLISTSNTQVEIAPIHTGTVMTVLVGNSFELEDGVTPGNTVSVQLVSANDNNATFLIGVQTGQNVNGPPGKVAPE